MEFLEVRLLTAHEGEGARSPHGRASEDSPKVGSTGPWDSQPPAPGRCKRRDDSPKVGSTDPWDSLSWRVTYSPGTNLFVQGFIFRRGGYGSDPAPHTTAETMPARKFR